MSIFTINQSKTETGTKPDHHAALPDLKQIRTNNKDKNGDQARPPRCAPRSKKNKKARKRLADPTGRTADGPLKCVESRGGMSRPTRMDHVLIILYQNTRTILRVGQGPR